MPTANGGESTFNRKGCQFVWVVEVTESGVGIGEGGVREEPWVEDDGGGVVSPPDIFRPTRVEISQLG